MGVLICLCVSEWNTEGDIVNKLNLQGKWTKGGKDNKRKQEHFKTPGIDNLLAHVGVVH